MFEALRTLKSWQVVLLLIVAAATAGGVYGIYDWVSDTDTSTLSDDTQLVPVQYGDLTNTISASGSVVFPTTEQLTFNSAGTVEEVYVEESDTVKEGEVLAKLDNASIIPLKEAVIQAQIDLEDAEETLEEAQNTYAEQRAVTQAKIDLRDAEEELEEAQTPYSESDIAYAEDAVERARQRLLDAQAQAPIDITSAEYVVYTAHESYYASLLQYIDGEITIEEFNKVKGDWEEAKLNLETVENNADNAVTDSESNLVEAEKALEEIKAGADPLNVELKQLDVISAQDALAEAEEALEKLKAGAVPPDVELKQLEVASAQAALDEALGRLGNTTIVAPFGGIVSELNVEPGQKVNANSVVIEMVDTSVVELSAIVDEIDILQVKEGQKATISLDAMPDTEFSGEVYSISTFAVVRSGVVSYPVSIRLTVALGIQVREGMSATASIVVESASNVLLIPNQAIGGSFDNPVVSVMVNGQLETKSVTLGATDYQWTEVVDGLREGDMVVVETAQGGSTGGGFPGGAFPGGQHFPGAGGMLPGGGGFRR